jgi:hypothetical protein
MRHRVSLGAGVLALAGAAAAVADSHPPITSRDYTLDLYQGTVLGGSKTIGMGGAVLGVAEGATGMDENPAAPAVRPMTRSSTWDWDATADWLNPDLGDDLDNAGIASRTSTLLLTGGLVGQYREWALGVSFSFRRDLVTLDDGSQADPQSVVGHLILARSFLEQQLAVGIGVRAATFSIGLAPGGASAEPLFQLVGSAFELGASWRPAELSLRAGLAAALPVASLEEPTVSDCDPMSCAGYILPARVAVPWVLAAGAAWRFGPTPWNRKVDDWFRDEHALVVAADLVVTGPVSDGFGVAAFLAKTLQPSGREVNLSLRVGAEYECLPGWLRIRAGSYWEPARFSDVNGRLHATAGLDARFWHFWLFGSPHRVRASVTLDLAERYANGGLSVGFWH